MKKIIEQRKREKEEERLARQRVKELIEADKLARKGIKSEPSNPVTPPVQTPVTSSTPKDYTHTKIQVGFVLILTHTECCNISQRLLHLC